MGAFIGVLLWLAAWGIGIFVAVMLYRLVGRVGEVADELRAIRRHLVAQPDTSLAGGDEPDWGTDRP